MSLTACSAEEASGADARSGYASIQLARGAAIFATELAAVIVGGLVIVAGARLAAWGLRRRT